MSQGFLNRCIWTAVSSGTADFVVSAAAQNGYAPAGCLDPAVVNGAPYHYFAINGTEHEEGDGTYNTGTGTLARTTIRNSSTGAKVSFSSAPTVYMGVPIATDMVTIGNAVPGGTSGSLLYVDSSGNLAQNNASLTWDNSSSTLNIKGTVSLKDNATSAISLVRNGNDGSNNFVELVPKSGGTSTFFYEDGSFETNNFGDSAGFTAFGYNYGGVVNGARFASTAYVSWSSTSDAFFTLDTGIGRNGAGVVEINNGTLVSGGGAYASLKLLNVTHIAGTSSVAPINLTSGTNLTSAAAGAVEFDGKVFYATAAASSRQVVATEQIEVLSANRTFTNNTSAQAIFNATANGAVTLQGATTYEFEMDIAVSGLSSSAHTVQLGFGGTATLTGIGYFYDAQTGSTLAGPTTSLSGFIAVATATAVTASSTTTGLVLRVRGTVRVNAGGTFIPQLTQVTASAAAVVQTNSFIRLWPIGSNTVNNVGNWS